MGAPVKTKTWQYNADVLQAALGTVGLDNQTAIWQQITWLMAYGSSPWICDYSCLTTGNVGTKGDGVNRLTSAAALVWNSPGSAHSWIVLKQGTFSILFELSAPNVVRNVLTFVVSWAAGFTGGSATARPTATDEHVIVAATTWTGNGSTDRQLRLNSQMSNDGQCTRMFIYAAGAVQFWLNIEQVTNLTTGVIGPWFVQLLAGVPTVASLENTASCSPNAATTVVGTYTTECTLAGARLNTDQTTVNENDNTWPAFPLGLYVANAQPSGMRGKIGNFQDLWLASVTATDGDTYPVSAANFVNVGNLITPWNAGSFHTS